MLRLEHTAPLKKLEKKMSTKLKIRRFLNRTRFYFSFLLLAFYLVVGFLFLFTEIWSDLLPKARFTIGIILVLFGILRFYVAYRRFASKKNRIELLKQKIEDAKTAQ
jgi:cytochrome c biogenesis protein CcdA